MNRRERAVRKVLLKEKRYIINQLMKEKRSEELESLEEVFDKSTLMLMYRLLNRGLLQNLNGVVRSGKESRIYWGKDTSDKDIAVKIYLTQSSEFRKGMLPYIDGDPRFKHVKRDTRSLIYLWAQKEFKNLHLCWINKIKAPRPIFVEGNILLMHFIGKNGEPAPLLKEKLLRDYLNFYDMIIKEVTNLYIKANLVHGDLSEYNIMIYRNNPILIDFSQAVHVTHPHSSEFFLRDIRNINRYFNNIVPTVSPEELLEKVMEKIGRDKYVNS
ncbi:serine protein kinase RIO [[Eubacterium] cellulosolvens]